MRAGPSKGTPPATKARELGGNVLTEPFDEMDAGRMAVTGDPTGAALLVWEPRGTIGAEIVNGPGALALTQLNTAIRKAGSTTDG
jgi:hypothetical protein